MHKVLTEGEILSWMKEDKLTDMRHQGAGTLVKYRISHEPAYDDKLSISKKKKKKNWVQTSPPLSFLAITHSYFNTLIVSHHYKL